MRGQSFHQSTHPTVSIRSRVWGSGAVGFALWIAVLLPAGDALHGCDACNVAFAQEVADERADTPAGRDMKAAMERQRNLNLGGLGSPHLVEIIAQTTGIGANPEDSATPATLEIREKPEVTGPSRAAVPTESAIGVAQSAAPRAGIIPGPWVQSGGVMPQYFEGEDFIEIIERDYSLGIPTTSYVPQSIPDEMIDKRFSIDLHEGMTYIGNGVVYDGFLTNGKVPAPTFIMEEGDIVEFKVVNKGTIPHGASIHPAYTQTSKYLGKIDPGKTGRVVFRAATPGVYMYHCAPGGHAIPMHVLFGQYGMMVVKPKSEKFQLEKDLGRAPDLELYMIQHEIYASGKDAIESKPSYVAFNGRLFQYVENPIMVRPGDYVRMYFLNIGPNLLSTFHIVGIIWDYVYWQGNPAARMPGGQSVTAGPTDSWVIEFRIPPDEGAYTMLSHAVGSTSRGAIGLMVADRNAKTEPVILADGPTYTEEEMKEYAAKAQRIVSPFHIGTSPADEPVVYGPEVKEVKVSIIGNSFHPKVIQVAPGTKVTWTNEDVFTYLAGEYAGIHNAAAMNTPDDAEGFTGPLLAHGESFSHVFEPFEYTWDYLCTPHPYMRGRVIVKEPEYSVASAASAGSGGGSLNKWSLGILGLCLVLSTMALVGRSKEKE